MQRQYYENMITLCDVTPIIFMQRQYSEFMPRYTYYLHATSICRKDDGIMRRHVYTLCNVNITNI